MLLVCALTEVTPLHVMLIARHVTLALLCVVAEPTAPLAPIVLVATALGDCALATMTVACHAPIRHIAIKYIMVKFTSHLGPSSNT